MTAQRLKELIKEMDSLKNPEKIKIFQRFFKTGKGEYGEGDIFLGLNVPTEKELAKKYQDLDFSDIQELLESRIHEHRMLGTMILCNYSKSQPEKAFKFYLKNAKRMNNWDLVDCSAPQIVGKFLVDQDKQILHKLAESSNLWEKRISIVSTLSLIRNNQLQPTLEISKKLLRDKHDLIHKAVGWMLRELGKKDEKLLEKFLHDNYSELPRTSLRYAIERFSPEKREYYLYKIR